MRPTASSASFTGILLLCAGLGLFAVQDLILKMMSGSYPLSEAMVLRALTAVPLLYALVRATGGRAFAPGWPRMILRGLVMFFSYSGYYLALPVLPLATTVALYFSAPLMIVVLSVVTLGERVSPQRWVAVLAGFVGVLVMIRPGSTLFEWAALLPVISGLAYATSMIMARVQGAYHSAAELAFHGNLVFLGCALILTLLFGNGAHATDAHPSLAFLLRGWVVPTFRDFMLMTACGVIAAVGSALLTQAYRIAPSASVAPFEYTALIWSVLYGWLFWSDWPAPTTWTGIAIIVGSGLLVLRAEPRPATG